MDIIVARDDAWGIGKDGELLRRISADMKRFRAMTTGNVLIVGRKTLESFPDGNPLPERVNIVLTKNMEYPAEGVVLCHSLEKLPELLHAYEGKGVFVAGAASFCRSAGGRMLRISTPLFPQIRVSPVWIKTLTGYSWKKEKHRKKKA